MTDLVAMAVAAALQRTPMQEEHRLQVSATTRFATYLPLDLSQSAICLEQSGGLLVPATSTEQLVADFTELVRDVASALPSNPEADAAIGKQLESVYAAKNRRPLARKRS